MALLSVKTSSPGISTAPPVRRLADEIDPAAALGDLEQADDDRGLVIVFFLKRDLDFTCQLFARLAQGREAADVGDFEVARVGNGDGEKGEPGVNGFARVLLVLNDAEANEVAQDELVLAVQGVHGREGVRGVERGGRSPRRSLRRSQGRLEAGLLSAECGLRSAEWAEGARRGAEGARLGGASGAARGVGDPSPGALEEGTRPTGWEFVVRTRELELRPAAHLGSQ